MQKENSMSMEKNGAINIGTPRSGCCGGGCHSEKSAELVQQSLPFPENEQEADAMEGNDLTKQAIDQVVDRTQKPS